MAARFASKYCVGTFQTFTWYTRVILCGVREEIEDAMNGEGKDGDDRGSHRDEVVEGIEGHKHAREEKIFMLK